MSGENIYHLIGDAALDTQDKTPGHASYTGNYTKHMGEMSKPSYSTFFEKGKEYDGTHARYFKQRDAIIGPSVNEGVDPKNFLKAGGGVKFLVPPVHEEKTFTKAPLDRRGRKEKSKEDNYSATFPEMGKGKNLLGVGSGDDHGNNINDDEKSPARMYSSLNCTDALGNGKYDAGSAELGIRDNDRNARGGQQDYNNGNNQQGKKGLSGVNGLSDGYNDAEGNADDLYGPDALGGKKDFVTSNIIEMSNLVPKRRKDQPEYATSRKTFGKPPTYLHRVKREIQGEKESLKCLELAQAERSRKQKEKYVYRLDETERIELIAKLKKNLSESTAFLNTMPFAKDTVSQVKRKADIESKIKEIESALSKLDRDAIFVYHDHPACEQWAKNAALAEARRFTANSAE